MCIERLKDLLVNPVVAIAKAKREKKTATTLVVLFAEMILIDLALLLGSIKLGSASLASALISLPLFGIVCSLFCGFLVQLVFTILGGKGKYFEGLTCVVYPAFPMSVGLLVGSLMSFAPVIGSGLSAMAILIFALIGVAMLYRSVKELFNVDMITAWVGVSVLIIGLVVSFYFLLASVIVSNPQFLAMMGV